METPTQNRGDRIRRLLSEHVKKDVPIANPIQEAYEKRLTKDTERTSRFLHQAEQALEKLDEPSSVHESWTEETHQKAHTLALYEKYQKLPYSVMKNDSLGTATAAHLTGEAVVQQTAATEELQKGNTELQEELDVLKVTLADYKSMSALLEKRIAGHPSRVKAMEQKLHNAQHVDNELTEKTEQVRSAIARVRKVEEKLQQHMARVVTKLHAMLDWENTGMVDEDTFKTRIKQSMQLLQQLVSRLVQDPERWVPVTAGSPEEQLVQLMHRNSLLEIDNSGELAIRLRNYGGEF